MLRGMGAALSVPLLEAMTPLAASPAFAASEANSAPPLRFACLYMPNGVLPEAWYPEGKDREFQLSYMLEPLAPVKEKLLILNNLYNRNSVWGEGHYVKTAGFLTGVKIHKTGGRDIRNAVSLDQLIAQHVGQQTALPSLELGTEPVRNQVDMGFSTVYGGHISWRTPTLPATKEIHPQLAFDRLFRSTKLAASDDDRSVLDLVAADADRLRNRVGNADRQKLDEYLDAVRALEQRVDRVRARGVQTEAPVPADMFDDDGDDDHHPGGHERGLPAGELERPQPGIPQDFSEHVRLMLDMIVTAFWTDATRVSTFLLGNAVSGRNFSFLDGVRGSHHELSHHEGKEDKKEQYKRCGRFYVQQYAYLLERLNAIQEGERTLLDNSVVMFGCGLRDGNAHDPHNLPLVLAGSAGGKLDTGRYVTFPWHSRLCNMYATLLDCLDVPCEQFGDSDGRFPQLLKT